MNDSERYQLRDLASYALLLRSQAQALATEIGRLSRQVDELLADSKPDLRKRWWQR